MSEFIYDMSEFSESDILDKNYIFSSELEAPLTSIEDEVFDYELFDSGKMHRDLLEDSVHSVFNDIVNIKPASDDEDSKNLIMSWDINEQNFDTLPDNPLPSIKQEVLEELSLPSDHESTGRRTTWSSTSSDVSVSIIETPPVSPEEEPVNVAAPPSSVNILVIDNMRSIQSNPGRRIVPAVPLRSQNRRSRKINDTSDNSLLSAPECKERSQNGDGDGGIQRGGLLLPKNERGSLSTSFLSTSQLQALKRQQRMIKNRESASLSRKKKKEYVTSLENEIVLLKEQNVALRKENFRLRQQLQCQENLQAWHKPNNKLIDRSKKITAVCAVLFLISFNVASFRSFPSTSDSHISQDIIYEYHGGSENHQSRSLLWTDESLATNSSTDDTSDEDTRNWKSKTNEKCPLYINQTESIRLDNELRKWIDAYPMENATNDQRKFTNESETNSWPYIVSTIRKERKQSARRPFVHRELSTNREVKMYQFEKNVFDVNEPLYEAMERKQDTFYVVSFSDDHLLLPAVSQNQTLRPKMSLLLPSITSNDLYSSSRVIRMMQIDCTVLDTRLLYLNEKDIPARLKTQSLKSAQKSNSSYAKQGERRKLHQPYSFPSPAMAADNLLSSIGRSRA